MPEEEYSKTKVRLFLRYLLNAAKKVELSEIKHHHKKFSHKTYDPSDDINIRLADMSDVRREEIETRIKMFYTNNKYLPFEIRLKKIKKQIDRMYKKKKHGKKKLYNLKRKIVSCEKIIESLKKLS